MTNLHSITRLQMAFLSLFLLLLLGVFFAPAMPFIIDGAIYIDMAKAMSAEGTLSIAKDGGVDGAPALTKYLTHDIDGFVYPQYPSGYAYLASPFYSLLGIRGLMLMNALALFGSALLLHHITTKLFSGKNISLYALGIFLGATFVSNYAVAIWPHMISLLCWLGAIASTLKASAATDKQQRFIWFAIAGIIIGTGINIRVDSILIFVIIFAWLKLFAHPDDRGAPMWVALGMVPALLLAAWLNQLKFGVYSPISYGSSAGTTDLSRYTFIMLGGGLLLLTAWLINIPKLVYDTQKQVPRKYLLSICIIGLSGTLLFAGPFIWKILYGTYVLVFNLQAHNAYYQAGVDPNEFGQLMFWGYPKKALIQSLPFLPLLLIPVLNFFRGRNVYATSLCLLSISTPITFYAINQWHGGGSYNMRYFIPALPFISILTAVGLHEVMEKLQEFHRRDILITATLAAFLYLGVQEAGQLRPALYAPMALYPQWIIALLVSILVIGFIWRPHSQFIARSTILMSGFAIVYSMFVSLENESSHEKARAELKAHADEISKSIPPHSLVLTQLPVLLLKAETNNISVMVAREENTDNAIKAANSFAKAGHCVYLHNAMIYDLLTPHMPVGTIKKIPAWAARDTYPNDPRFAFFTLASQYETCSF